MKDNEEILKSLKKGDYITFSCGINQFYGFLFAYSEKAKGLMLKHMYPDEEENKDSELVHIHFLKHFTSEIIVLRKAQNRD